MSLEELAIETGDVSDSDTLRALKLAGTGIGAVTESEFVHLGDHGLRSLLGLGTTLRKQSERTDAGCNEKHCRTVLTGSYASTATDASCCIHALFSLIVRDKESIGILSRAGTD